jgi:hypothetical protein
MMALALAQVVIVAACNSDSPTAPTSGESFRLEDFVASASVGGSQGQLRSGPSPTAGSGPAVTVSGNQVVVNGGVTDLNVVAGSEISRIFVTLAGENFGLASSSSGLGDRYEVDLAAPATTADLILTFPQNLPIEEFDVFFAAADESGAVGPLTRLTFDVLQVGTGDVQVTLGWDTEADVDLHVIDPNGDEVYWANRTVPSGGELDLDSNAGCSEGVSNENITWPEGLAPRGTYIVRVDYWSNCGVESTDYTVLVNNGGNVEVFSGTFEGSGDGGGAGSGIDITTFERTTGPAPASTPRAPRPPTLGLTTK